MINAVEANRTPVQLGTCWPGKTGVVCWLCSLLRRLRESWLESDTAYTRLVFNLSAVKCWLA